GYTFYFRKSQNLQKQFSATRQQRDHLLSESFQHHTTIKMHTAEETWATRFKNLQTLYNLSHLRMNFIQRTINIVVDTTIHLIMITTIVFATQKMLASNLRPGEMLAILILTWRILSPMKTIFNFLPNWNNFTNQIHQFNHLMRLPSEITQSTTSAIFTTKKGVLELSK